jgi:aspartate aminotransferase-like enzyme
MDASDLKRYVYTRFSKTDRVLYDNNSTYGRWNNPITEMMSGTASTYVVSNAYEGRPDLIAHALYGNASLDWVLIAMNNASDALNWPRAGATIIAPSKSLIASELI